MNKFSAILYTLFFALLNQVSIAQRATVKAEKMNVLYIGIDNPVTIIAERLKCEDLVAEINAPEARIEKNKGITKCLYYVRVMQPGIAKIYVYEQLSGKQKRLIDSSIFRVKRSPDPITSVGGKLKGGLVKHSELKAQIGIILLFEGLDFEYRIQVLSFSLYHCKEGKLSIIKNSGPVFNNDIKIAIANAKYGDVLVFDDIKGQGENGTTRKMLPLKFIIDGYRNKLCDNGKLSLQSAPLFYKIDTNELTNDLTTENMNCESNCIDESIGNYDESRKKTGWWIYNKIDSGKKVTIRKEYFIEDTATQYFYTNDYVSKLRTYTGTVLNGKYAEYHTENVLRVEGQYKIDTVGIDTSLIIDPITLDESIHEEPIMDEVEAGTWNYYTTAGKLYLRKHYQKGKLVREENF